MEEKKDSDCYEKKIQKLREEIEKGWSGPDSKITITNIIASKQVSGNEKNWAVENRTLLNENKGFHLISTSNPLPRCFRAL